MLTEVVALFGAGVASFLAPCLVPLLPAYLGIIAGLASPHGHGHGHVHAHAHGDGHAHSAAPRAPRRRTKRTRQA